MIDSLSPQLRRALAEACGEVVPGSSREVEILEAMKLVAARIDRGETGLHDPLNSGDEMALALARM